MKELILKPKISQLILKKNIDLYQKDFTQVPKSCFPGEWVLIKEKAGDLSFIGYINPFIKNGPLVRIIETHNGSEEDEALLAHKIILKNLLKAINNRKIFRDYGACKRLAHGSADNLPGLIVDQYINVIFIQINTAGIDRFRNEIKEFLSTTFPDQKIHFLDSLKYRKNEGLPQYPQEEFKEDLEIQENGFTYYLPPKLMQKVGYYYDHRENRKKLELKLKDLNISLEQGLDLYCYMGSWGMHLLRGGVKNLTFVDQGNFEEQITANLNKNKLSGRGRFVRSDVFKFLDDALSSDQTFNVVVGDPPAFSKELKNVDKALVGYQKLHRKVMKVLAPEALYAAASCTHNISFSDLAKTVYEASLREGKTLQIIDVGVQGGDHPFFSFKSREHYLKYILYIIRERE
ncbi:MAG: class I SAM-dependent rRNA methyltransferase [Deltaproteobacteria bacterium]|nr:MAG: class I SAM-dependent rRNA methyltransferase [Deltaproteobacteria bacterium]